MGNNRIVRRHHYKGWICVITIPYLSIADSTLIGDTTAIARGFTEYYALSCANLTNNLGLIV